jgi:hypothetical protein
MTGTTAELTPAENRARAAQALRQASGISPATELHRNLLLAAIAHELAAIAVLLEPPPVPQIPGLPAGWKLETAQAEKNNRLWGYILTSPAGRTIRSRFQWGYSETALKQGIRRANELAAEQDTPLADLHAVSDEPLPEAN